MGLLVLLILLSLPALSAPELSEGDRQRLADGTTDRDDVLDEQDGFYVLLRNASTWQGDDFSGDAGAAVAPPPDYGFLREKPGEARGNAYLIEGWLAGADRWPTEDNHDRDKLMRSGDPAWGDQVTRWTIVTEKGNADATLIVLFNDPTAKMTAPKQGSKVRIAARFHKLWTIQSSTGKPFTYPVFIGGAAQTVEETASSASGGSGGVVGGVLAAILIVVGFFIAMRFLIRRLSTGRGGGTMLRDRLDEMRRQRESMENQPGGEDEEDIGDLPDDPVAALDLLRDRHDEAR